MLLLLLLCFMTWTIMALSWIANNLCNLDALALTMSSDRHRQLPWHRLHRFTLKLQQYKVKLFGDLKGKVFAICIQFGFAPVFSLPIHLWLWVPKLSQWGTINDATLFVGQSWLEASKKIEWFEPIWSILDDGLTPNVPSHFQLHLNPVHFSKEMSNSSYFCLKFMAG